MMKNIAGIVFGAALAGAVGVAQAADTYKVDPAHAFVYYKINHFGWSDLFGRFNTVDGEFVVDESNPDNSSVSITIDAASIDTNHEKRNDHLRSPDFFNVAEFPTITFKSTKIEKTGDITGKVTGDLTILAVTKPVTFDFKWNKPTPHFARKDEIHTGFSAELKINRSDWGMTKFVPNIGDEVTLFLEVEAIKQ